MNIDKLFGRLKKHFPEDVYSEPRDPFEVLIYTIISQRTRDEQTDFASQRLLSVYPSIKELAKADVKKIERLIKPAGFYRVKARKIKEVSEILLKRFDGEVPDDFESLMQLPSVGRKTANCVLVFGFGIPAIPVDTHVHRISNRLGLVKTKTPEETESELRNILKRKYWLDINHMFVRFGQTICRPINPKCEVCPISDLCEWYKKNVK
ncbi:MAG: endonuclease III [Thermoplasmata archaeon]|nr:MAG: endonuclease III [Thermoplasmata archaeon]